MPEELVTVGTYSTLYEANLVKAELEAFDVDAVLADDNTVHMNWLYSNLIGGVKVRVPQSECEEARRIMRLDAAPAPDAPDTPAPAPAIVCPACGSAKSHYFLDKRGSFLTWLFVGIPLMPAFSRRICDHCGAKWKV
jgi:hypothetical protein